MAKRDDIRELRNLKRPNQSLFDRETNTLRQTKTKKCVGNNIRGCCGAREVAKAYPRECGKAFGGDGKNLEWPHFHA